MLAHHLCAVRAADGAEMSEAIEGHLDRDETLECRQQGRQLWVKG
jgi:hypothetical protein